jgi:hypothetical protein
MSVCGRQALQRPHLGGRAAAWIARDVRLRVARVGGVLCMDPCRVGMPHPSVSLGVIHAASVQAQAAEPFYSIRKACEPATIRGSDRILGLLRVTHPAGKRCSDWVVRIE